MLLFYGGKIRKGREIRRGIPPGAAELTLN